MGKFLALAVAVLFLNGCHFFASKTQSETVYLTTLMENGKKVWKPSDLEAYAGKVVFEVENTLDEPHGFVVKGATDPVVVGPKKTAKVTANLKLGTYRLECHLHPAHVHSSIEIVKRGSADKKEASDL